MKSIKSLFIRLYIKIKEKKFEYKNKRVKYLFRNRNSNKLIVVFSGFAGRNVKAKYNLVRTLSKNKESQLFILDDFGFMNVGSYYLGDNMELWRDEVIIRLINKFSQKDIIKKVIFCGSSKGGSAALLYGFKMDADYIIAGSPQYDILKYLSQNEYHLKILEAIVGNNQNNKECLTGILNKTISNSKKISVVKLLISSLEESYTIDVSHLINDLKSNNIKVSIDDMKFNSHDEIGIFFPSYLLECLADI